MPPPLDRTIGKLPPASGRLTAPVEAAADVGEFFYPQFATRLSSGTPLPEKLRRSLNEYHATKLVLLKDLRAELARTQAAEPAARAQALQALARRQAATFATQERNADQLRRDLLEADRDWSDYREWHLRDKQRRGFSPLEIAQVMRAYAYFQNGLTPAQRRLLLEITVDLSAAVDNVTKAAAQPHQFFSPEPARVQLPDHVAPDVSARMAAYQTKKAALKKELYDTIQAHDGAGLTFFRNTFGALAEKQAPAFAELERIADEIRVGLGAQTVATKPSERSPLPAAISARLAILVRARVTAQAEATHKVEAVMARGRGVPARVTYTFEESGLKFIVLPFPGRAGMPAEGKKAVEQMTADITAIAADYGARLAEFVNDRDAIRKEAATALVTEDPATIERALLAAVRLNQAEENADAYREYRLAAFEPGLSLPQRYLLFDAAIQRLELPLPRGELQPTRRGNGW
jgi:hypothetical protein